MASKLVDNELVYRRPITLKEPKIINILSRNYIVFDFDGTIP